MTTSAFFHRSLTLIGLCAALSACANAPWSSGDGEARRLYHTAHQYLQSGDYADAIKLYQDVAKLAPPAALSSQAQAELIYSYYKQGDYQSAAQAAEDFISRYPNHPRADYVTYLHAAASLQMAVDESDAAQRAPALDEAYKHFQELSQKFPKSPFNEKALRSLVFVRQQLAQAHLDQAKAELRRGDEEPALSLARYVEQEFGGTPAAREATALIADPAAAQRQLAAASPPVAVPAAAPAESTAAAPSPASAAPAAPAQAAAEQRIPIHDPQWIMQQNPERYTVELVPAASEEAVRNFVESHKIHGSARYPSPTDKERSTLIHGLYPDAESAHMAASQLMKRWGLRDAPVRSFAEVQSTLGGTRQ